ncbi:MAG: hypothetical protein HYR90_03915 [Candidatus Andersenbacteria bacterium]|nr:hypothetical protein [Candidatus Andersenbacteria bacterium]MBI3250405.1 hypothetical protein [Candidatus Andersenbacteria bacterium]
MDTLLTKVKSVEAEAAKMIEALQQAEHAKLASLRSAEETVIEETRQEAEKEARAIVKEKMDTMTDEVNTIKQQSEGATRAVHEAAEKNRKDVLTLSHNLFKKEYNV